MNLLISKALFLASPYSSLLITQWLDPPSTSSSSIVFSINEDSDENEVSSISTPQTDALDNQSASFTNEPKAIKPHDPLVVSLTQMDEETLNISLIVKNDDAISAEQIEAVNAVLSTPPVKENKVSDGCRGLCNRIQ